MPYVIMIFDKSEFTWITEKNELINDGEPMIRTFNTATLAKEWLENHLRTRNVQSSFNYMVVHSENVFNMCGSKPFTYFEEFMLVDDEEERWLEIRSFVEDKGIDTDLFFNEWEMETEYIGKDFILDGSTCLECDSVLMTSDGYPVADGYCSNCRIFIDERNLYIL